MPSASDEHVCQDSHCELAGPAPVADLFDPRFIVDFSLFVFGGAGGGGIAGLSEELVELEGAVGPLGLLSQPVRAKDMAIAKTQHERVRDRREPSVSMEKDPWVEIRITATNLSQSERRTESNSLAT